jgi:hypothetical protein
MIHYHGTPITPKANLEKLAGRHFCISYVEPRDIDWCTRNGASVMMDNGAFTSWTQGKPVDWNGYYKWLEPRLEPPHWAVLPDVIDGDEQANDELLKGNPFRKELVAPVWHLHESFDRLKRLIDQWPRVCFGSSGAYAKIGTSDWNARIDSAWEITVKTGSKPWIHMLRAMSAASKGPWPFASADSTNIARNHKGSRHQRAQDIEQMAARLDAQNPTPKRIVT